MAYFILGMKTIWVQFILCKRWPDDKTYNITSVISSPTMFQYFWKKKKETLSRPGDFDWCIWNRAHFTSSGEYGWRSLWFIFGVTTRSTLPKTLPFWLGFIVVKSLCNFSSATLSLSSSEVHHRPPSSISLAIVFFLRPLTSSLMKKFRILITYWQLDRAGALSLK